MRGTEPDGHRAPVDVQGKGERRGSTRRWRPAADPAIGIGGHGMQDHRPEASGIGRTRSTPLAVDGDGDRSVVGHRPVELVVGRHLDGLARTNLNGAE